MRRFIIPLIIAVFLLVQVAPVSASAKSTKTSSGALTVNTSYVKYKNLVKVYMVNLGGVARVDYALMYQANGVGQGVQGGFAPSKKGVFAKDLYLGTCSAKVCTPHKNIKNIKLQVTTKYKNGKSATRTYTVK